MHTCQILLVQADTLEQAKYKVVSNIEDLNNWSDWHEADDEDKPHFAGRWDSEVFGTPDEFGKYNPDNPNFLLYSDDPALADNVITTFLDFRMEAIRTLQGEVAGQDLFNKDYNPNRRTELNLTNYLAKSLLDIYSDNWTADSGVYDLERDTASLYYFTDRVKLAPEKQWLIPVDFHY